MLPKHSMQTPLHGMRLRRGGLFFESSPFDNASDDPLAIHQRASVAMADALEGLEFVKRLEGGIKVWRKP